MNELLNFAIDFAGTGAATITFSIAGLAITATVALKSKKRLGRAFKKGFESVKKLFINR